VVVDEEAGAGASLWHHIRPVERGLYNLRLGQRTVQRLARATDAAQVDDYAEYSASEPPPDTSNLSVVYEFEISPVGYADVGAEVSTGGVAGVIIPLPRSSYASGGIMAKYPPERPFNEEGGNGYGFAPLQNGACPDDTMDARSPYRDEGGALRRVKRGGDNGDACVVVYIVDGGPNDEDGVVNGVIWDGIGCCSPSGPGPGGRSHGGALGPLTLAALALILALASALSLVQIRRRRRSSLAR